MSIAARFLCSMTALPVLVPMLTVPASGQDGGGAAPEGTRARGGRGGSVAPAGPIPRRADGKPNLTGRWIGLGPDVPSGMLTNSVILEDHPPAFGITAGHSLIID